jgi:hypothetical protein
MIYLIEYDRGLGRLLRLDGYLPAQRRRAEEDRLGIELELLREQVDREVVLLEASSEDELRKTHRRYFERLDELLTPASTRPA